jgi:hypothetical protein
MYALIVQITWFARPLKLEHDCDIAGELVTANWSLRIGHCELVTANWSLRIGHCELVTTNWSLQITQRCSIFAYYW